MNPAFAYLYDDFLSDKRLERDVSALENELARRGIEGRIARLAMFRSAKEMVMDMARAGVKNIIVVGNDQTLQKLMWFLPDMDVILGYIPMGRPADVAARLGIPMGIAAVDVIAARLIDTVDVGRIGDHYFLGEVSLPATIAALEIEGRYRLRPVEGGAIAVRNLALHGEAGEIDEAKDGWLDAVVQSRVPVARGRGGFWARKELTETRLRFRTGRLISEEPVDVFVDGHPVNGFSFDIEMTQRKLRLITGGRRISTLQIAARTSRHAT